MHDLPLTSLRALAAVYKTGGIRPAARLLQVTHAAVSRHLRDLEAFLGVALLETRAGSVRVVFTPQGEALGKSSLHNLSELSSTVAAVKERRQGNSVIIATTASIATRWLLPRLPRLSAVASWVELSVVVEQKLSDPSEQGADLSLRMGRGPWPGLACVPLMDDTLFPVASPAYWREAGKPSHPDGLVGLDLLHDRDPHASWAQWRATHGPAELDIRKGARFTSSDLVLRAAAAGVGIALARGRLIDKDLETGALLRPLGDRALTIPDAYWVVQRMNAPKRSAVECVRAWLMSEAGHPEP